jgi:hypothetical protein
MTERQKDDEGQANWMAKKPRALQGWWWRWKIKRQKRKDRFKEQKNEKEKTWWCGTLKLENDDKKNADLETKSDIWEKRLKRKKNVSEIWPGNRTGREWRLMIMQSSLAYKFANGANKLKPNQKMKRK